MGKFEDITGQRFGRLIVIKKADNYGNGNYKWLCKCDCGNEKEIEKSSLIAGLTKSCGCLHNEGNRKTHGGKHTRLYHIWLNMKARCYNNNTKEYKYYGGRGITVCDEWKNDFKNFRDWSFDNGYMENVKRNECTIDRIDYNGNYEPSNCRWVDQKIQNRNSRHNKLITYNNETHCMSEWAEILNISYSCLKRRFRKNWEIEKALTTPVRVTKRG